MKKLVCLLLCAALLAACGAPAPTVPVNTTAPAETAPVETAPAATEPEAPAEPILKELYAEDFRMGVSCEAISHWDNNLSEIGNPEKEALILKQFNSITFGNELKPAYNMDYRSPEATETDLPFGKNPAAIEMLDWAKANGMPVRGHTLVWHSQCDDAVFCKNYTPVYGENEELDPACMVDAETMLARMESYINHVMEYVYANGYGNVIYAWDVVNEAIEPGQNEDNMRDSYWYRILGSGFVMEAFRITREAVEKYSAEYASLYGVDAGDKEALKTIQPSLFYNDYNEHQAGKRKAIIKLVEPIAAAGYLDGIGMQGHISDTTNIMDYINSLKMYSDVVSEVQITELDVSQSGSGPKAEYNQGMFYNNFFKALVNAKANGAKLTGVTVWGLTDDNSWKKETSPLLFNGDLTPKMAFDGIVFAKTGETLPMPELPETKAEAVFYDFEDGNAVFVPRWQGAGKIELVEDGDGHAVRLTNQDETYYGLSYDVTEYLGMDVEVSFDVKTEDPTVKVSGDIDGLWPNYIVAETESGGYRTVSGLIHLPEDLPALKIYIETEGKADLFVDNFSLKPVA